MRADVACTLDDNVTAAQLGRSERDRARRAHAVQHTEGSDRGRISRSSSRGIDTGDPCRLARDSVHVDLTRTDVLGREIATPEHVDPSPE